MKWAVHSHIGVCWDGGVRLLGIYRLWIIARIICRMHVLRNPMRSASVVRANDRLINTTYFNNAQDFKNALH